jgi:ribosomal-protein-alanine N-acetyltransferase
MVSVGVDLIFREMTLADLSIVVVNDRLSYSHPWSRGIFSDCLQAGNDCWIVEQDKRLVGHSILSVGAGECHLLNVCIIPEFQDLGLGRRLVEHMLDRAVQLEANTVFLEVRPSTPAAYHLYIAMGFNEVGTRKAYYPAKSGREDAIIMAKELSLNDY